jgi:glutamate synthase domain-containing protein 3
MTGSAHAARLLADWENALQSFWKVIPRAALTVRVETEEVEEVASEPTRGVAD